MLRAWLFALSIVGEAQDSQPEEGNSQNQGGIRWLRSGKEGILKDLEAGGKSIFRKFHRLGVLTPSQGCQLLLRKPNGQTEVQSKRYAEKPMHVQRHQPTKRLLRCFAEGDHKEGL